MDFPTANEALQWACIGWLLRWAQRHSSVCHREPGEILARIGARMDGAEHELGRLAKNIHALRNDMSPIALWVAQIRERLRMGDE